jgi:hypothetical protein
MLFPMKLGLFTLSLYWSPPEAWRVGMFISNLEFRDDLDIDLERFFRIVCIVWRISAQLRTRFVK